MKKLRIAVLLVTVISLVGLFLACPSSSSSTTPPAEVNKTPVASDYNISGTGNYVAGDTPAFSGVTVTRKDDASTGAVTVYYAKDGATRTTTPPGASEIGVYNVTFDVAAATGWTRGVELNAGFVNITRGDFVMPVIGDFTATGFPVEMEEGSTRPAVSIVANSGKTAGAITIVYTNSKTGAVTTGSANGATGFPTAAGFYGVSINVAEDPVGRFSAVTGLSDGWTVYIYAPADPNAPIEVTQVTFDSFDFKVGGVSFTSETAPQNVTYTGADLPLVVTFKGTVNPPYPIATTQGQPIITYRQTNSQGAQVTVNTPKNAGTYFVNVVISPIVDKPNHQAWNGLNLNLTLIVDKRKPTAGDYDIGNLTQSAAGLLLTQTYVAKHVSFNRLPVTHQDPNNTSNTITDKPGVSSSGVISLYYEGKDSDGNDVSIGPVLSTGWSGTGTVSAGFPSTGNNTPPQKAGTYAVTFTVGAPTAGSDEATNWIATGTAVTDRLSAGTLELKPLSPVQPQFVSHFWFDNDVLTVDATYTLITPGQTITFTPQLGNSTVVGWYEDGKAVTANTDGTYTFNKTAMGLHWVTLVVTANGGKYYSETVEIRVQ